MAENKENHVTEGQKAIFLPLIKKALEILARQKCDDARLNSKIVVVTDGKSISYIKPHWGH